MRSSRTQSGWVSLASARPPSPVSAEWTWKPSNSSASLSPRTMSGSSSMMRICFLSPLGGTVAMPADTLALPLRGDPEAEYRAAAVVAGPHGDLPVVRLGDVPDQRQADPGAADRLQADRARPVEAIEDGVALVLRHARAVVADLELHPVVGPAQRHLQPLAVSRVFDGVVDQVEDGHG